MQLNTMEYAERPNTNERESELGDDMSHEDLSDDEMRDSDSIDGKRVAQINSRLNTSMISNGDFGSHEHPSEMQPSHHHQFPPNHPLNALNNFMGMGGLHGLPSLQHNDVLEKLKMQVRDMKVGLMDQEYVAAHAAAFGANVLPTPINTAFTLPPTTMASFNHAAQSLVSQANNNINSHLNANPSSVSTVAAGALANGGHNNNPSFSFTSPSAPNTKDVNPASNSSTSSETSNSSQQNNGWSFEEQYKQVRQLYEINDDPKRKEFLDDLFSFMQKRGTPINRLPIMAKSVLDLYELYNLVIARGGLVDVINKKLWQEIIKGLHLPSSITSAAFTLRTQYMKYLYPYECEKKNLSTPAELQAAIDGNRREGRRSSYGQYEAMHNQMQMSPMARQALPAGMQQMSPLALVTHAAAANNQQAQAAAAAAAAHHRLMAPTFGQVPNLVKAEIEQRMIEYLQLIQVKKEQNVISSGATGMGLSPHHQPQQQQRQRSQSPEISPREALNALEMSRVALWQMYHNNTSPPASLNASPQGEGNIGCDVDSETQRSEALNLSDSPLGVATIKRERERAPSPEINDRDEFHQPPPAKRSGFPASFYLPPGMNSMAAAVNFHYKGNNHESDVEGEHNTTANSSNDDPMERQQHNEKSDDSAIENSPSTSAASAATGHISPISTKKIHLSKQQAPNNKLQTTTIPSTVNSTCNALDALNLLSGMQFRVTRNGTNSNGEQELAVNLELNGIKYSGVLTANTMNLADTSADASTANDFCGSTNINVNTTSDDTDTSKDFIKVKVPDARQVTMRDIDTPPSNHTNTGVRNGGPNINAKLKDDLIKSSLTSIVPISEKSLIE